jgi:hypothetical protein
MALTEREGRPAGGPNHPLMTAEVAQPCLKRLHPGKSDDHTGGDAEVRYRYSQLPRMAGGIHRGDLIFAPGALALRIAGVDPLDERRGGICRINWETCRAKFPSQDPSSPHITVIVSTSRS